MKAAAVPNFARVELMIRDALRAGTHAVGLRTWCEGCGRPTDCIWLIVVGNRKRLGPCCCAATDPLARDYLARQTTPPNRQGDPRHGHEEAAPDFRQGHDRRHRPLGAPGGVPELEPRRAALPPEGRDRALQAGPLQVAPPDAERLRDPQPLPQRPQARPVRDAQPQRRPAPAPSPRVPYLLTLDFDD